MTMMNINIEQIVDFILHNEINRIFMYLFTGIFVMYILTMVIDYLDYNARVNSLNEGKITVEQFNEYINNKFEPYKYKINTKEEANKDIIISYFIGGTELLVKSILLVIASLMCIVTMFMIVYII